MCIRDRAGPGAGGTKQEQPEVDNQTINDQETDMQKMKALLERAESVSKLSLIHIYILYPMCAMVLLAAEADKALYGQAMESGIRRVITSSPDRLALVGLSLIHILIQDI